MEKYKRDLLPPMLDVSQMRLERENAIVLEPTKTPFDQYGRRTYKRTCRKLGVTPISTVGE